MKSALATLEHLNADALPEMVTGLLQKVASKTEKIIADAAQIQFKQAMIDKLTSRPCKIHFKPAPNADLSFAVG
jgi:hypothetical protein